MIAASLAFGRIHLLPVIADYLELHRAGKLKILAQSKAGRSVLAPEVPTISELGQRDFEVTSWYGFFLPLRTPDSVVQTLMQESRKVLDLPDVKESIAKLGIEPAFKSGAEFARHIRQETETWAKVIKSAGIRAE